MRASCIDKFGRERVDAEMKDFLNLDFFPRYGAGIGVTRMIRAMNMSGLIADRTPMQDEKSGLK
jgi:hypothetical protein